MPWCESNGNGGSRVLFLALSASLLVEIEPLKCRGSNRICRFQSNALVYLGYDDLTKVDVNATKNEGKSIAPIRMASQKPGG